MARFNNWNYGLYKADLQYTAWGKAGADKQKIRVDVTGYYRKREFNETDPPATTTFTYTLTYTDAGAVGTGVCYLTGSNKPDLCWWPKNDPALFNPIMNANKAQLRQAIANP